MAEHSAAVEQVAEVVATEESEDALIARVSAGRRSGVDQPEDVDALLRLAGERNKAALDRLAK